MDKETNSRAYKRARNYHVLQTEGRCTVCPPSKGCNTSRNSKHGSKKPRKKDKQ